MFNKIVGVYVNVAARVTSMQSKASDDLSLCHSKLLTVTDFAKTAAKHKAVGVNKFASVT